MKIHVIGNTKIASTQQYIYMFDIYDEYIIERREEGRAVTELKNLSFDPFAMSIYINLYDCFMVILM